MKEHEVITKEDVQEIEAVIARLKRRGEFNVYRGENADREADATYMELVGGELNDEDVESLWLGLEDGTATEEQVKQEIATALESGAHRK